jgi:membrane dipeptidase
LGTPFINRNRYHSLPGIPQDYSARAVRLVQDNLVIDLLNQFRFQDFADDPVKADFWRTHPHEFTVVDFEEYRTSGMNVFALGHARQSFEDAVQFFAEWNSFIAQHDQWFKRIDDPQDFDAVKQDDRIGILLSFQDSQHFRSADDIDVFFGMGQRISQLTYNYSNGLGSGFLERTDGGLTEAGDGVIRRMNEVGMAVDLSHCGDRTTLEGLEATDHPALFTHATCRALVPNAPRCKTDEMIRALADTGGVMGIAFLRFMIRDREPVTIEHVLDHFEHVARLVGVDHLAIGSDMDLVGNPNPVGRPGAAPSDTTGRPNWERYRVHTDDGGRITIRGLDHAKRIYDLTEGLIRRSFSDEDISLILGGNARRVLAQIWST